MKIKSLTIIFVFIYCHQSFSQTLPSSIKMKDISGGTFTMGSNNLTGSPDQKAAAPEHQVTLSAYSISEAEITNAQYVEFLNAAFANGLIEIAVGSAGPDNGKRLIQGTSNSSYQGKVLYSLDGTRVMKDHDDGDGDGNPFTGKIEPENPLNIAYIDFNPSSNQFYVKNPFDTSDFHWINLCNYYDYGATQGSTSGPLLNDFNDWAGAGQNLSDELQGWTATNPSAAVNLPNQAEVSAWSVTFIRWWGAKAFAEYYNVNLPTEAQWEFAAKGGQNFTFSVYDGVDVSDANWNQASLPFATHHVRTAISGKANPFGLYNLGGNAWEWISDHYVAPYNTAAVTDPLIEDANSTIRCWRGGSWNYHEATLQSAIRFFDEENRGNDHFGFRIAGEHSTSGFNEKASKNSLHLFPNPTPGIINVKQADYLVQLKVFDVTGKLLVIQTLEKGISNQVNIEGPKGVYFVELKTAKNTSIQKVVKY